MLFVSLLSWLLIWRHFHFALCSECRLSQVPQVQSMKVIGASFMEGFIIRYILCQHYINLQVHFQITLLESFLFYVACVDFMKYNRCTIFSGSKQCFDFYIFVICVYIVTICSVLVWVTLQRLIFWKFWNGIIYFHCRILSLYFYVLYSGY